MDVDALFDEGYRLHREKRYPEAEHCYLQVVSSTPKHLQGNYLLGVLYLENGILDRAENYLKQAINLRPHLDRPYYALHLVYAQQGRSHMSERTLARYIEVRDTVPRVLVFGDSHSESTFSGILWCQAHLVGFYTMHRVGRDGLGAVDIAQYGASADKTVLFTFGEPDVRLHVGRQRDLFGRDVDEIIDDLVTRYFATIRTNVERFPGMRTIVAAVVPPCEQQPGDIFPKYGQLDDRVDFTRRMNAALEHRARSHGYGYLDVYTPFATEAGDMNPAFTDDHVHIMRQFHRIVEGALSALLCRMAVAEAIAAG